MNLVSGLSISSDTLGKVRFHNLCLVLFLLHVALRRDVKTKGKKNASFKICCVLVAMLTLAFLTGRRAGKNFKFTSSASVEPHILRFLPHSVHRVFPQRGFSPLASRVQRTWSGKSSHILLSHESRTQNTMTSVSARFMGVCDGFSCLNDFHTSYRLTRPGCSGCFSPQSGIKTQKPSPHTFQKLGRK